MSETNRKIKVRVTLNLFTPHPSASSGQALILSRKGERIVMITIRDNMLAKYPAPDRVF